MRTQAIPVQSLHDGRSRGRWRKALAQPRSIIGLAVIGFILLIAVIGPLVAPYAIDYYAGAPFQAPSAQYILGTDINGHDIYSRLLNGGQSVVWMSIAAATLGTALGTILGMLAGYSRGFLDQLIMRISDVWLALPMIVFVLMFVSVFGHEMGLLVLLIGLSHVPQVARVVRAAAADIATREYVESAKALGAGALRINLAQVLPNIMPTVLVEFGLRVVWSIAALAGLNVLGLGLTPPAADWGLMLNENRPGLSFQPIGVLVPLALIAVFAIGVNLLVEGVSRSLDVSLTEVSA